MKFYLNTEEDAIISVVGDKGVPVNSSLVRMGVKDGVHEGIISDMLNTNAALSSKPKEGGQYFVGQTLDEVLAKSEEIFL